MFRITLRQLFFLLFISIVAISCGDSDDPASPNSLDGLIISGNDETIAIIEVESHDNDDHDDEEHCEDLTDEPSCVALEHCEWHSDDSSCEDADGDDHDHDAHLDIDGFILENEDGAEVYRQFQGSIAGEISVNVNEAYELSVHFLGEDEEELEHDDEMHIYVEGVNAGTTSFIIELWHDGHADYTSLDVSVIVN